MARTFLFVISGLAPAFAAVPLVLALLMAAATPASALAVSSNDDPWRAVATRVSQPPTIDGHLDESAWQEAPELTGFRQIEPIQGGDPTVVTSVRILFDDQALYVAFDVQDPSGADGIRVSEVQRDFDYFQNDLVGISLDGFGDGRSAMAFLVNPFGAQRDVRVFDGHFFDREWKGVWEARTRIHREGWSAELRIPWSTLRYDPATEGWGIMLVRRSRLANELAGWPEWPRQNNPYTMRYAGTLDGLEPPPPSRNVQVQPYLTVRSEQRDGVGFGQASRSSELGGELKWALTSSSVLDLTVNTDFAEADVDRQVVNLTRFSVFLPENRPFFLENAGLFRLADIPWIEPFFSRRIGLDVDGTPIPIQAGARFVRQTPHRSTGAMVVRQAASSQADHSTFGVFRWQENLGARHRVGALMVQRLDQDPGGITRGNSVGSLDGYLQMGDQGFVRGMVSASRDDLDDASGWASLLWLGNRASWGYAGWVQRLISSDYRARTGFLPRVDLITTSPATTLDLRPSWLPNGILSYQPGLTIFAHHRASDRSFLEGFVRVRPIQLQFRDGARFELHWEPTRQELDRPFQPLPGAPIAPGSYRYSRYGGSFQSDPSAPLSASAGWIGGGYFDGRLERREISIRAAPDPRTIVTASFEENQLRGVGSEGASPRSRLVSGELHLSANPRTRLSTVYQRNTVTSQSAVNARLSWEFAPLSFVHLVVNDTRSIGPVLSPTEEAELPRERQILLKVSYLRGL